jgi:hypothetical protein
VTDIAPPAPTVFEIRTRREFTTLALTGAPAALILSATLCSESVALVATSTVVEPAAMWSVSSESAGPAVEAIVWALASAVTSTL